MNVPIRPLLQVLTAESTSVPSFAETALRLGGKSVDEAQRTGVIDTADDQVESLFSPQYQTVASPIHRAIWDRQVVADQFSGPSPVAADEEFSVVLNTVKNLVRKRRRVGTLLNERGKLHDDLLDELGRAGYWGLLIPRSYGGLGVSFEQFSHLITQMATVEPTVAGLASVHGCIGAVDPLRTFGNETQKRRFLPKLASGERLSAFALTEPGAGSDLTALRTTAVRRGDEFIVNGEKLFITNANCGRTIGLVCRIEGRPAVLVVDLPDEENESFRLKHYGIHALRRAHNCGLIFNDFAVPCENLLVPTQGDGLTIAYHGLNLGRVALCANAAGTLRLMLANMLPWSSFRQTYGQAIDRRELVQRRIGLMASRIVACDALVSWCSRLIDLGYRSEMECIIAKVFGSESLKEAAIEWFMKTHGGRSFLHGHLFGDNVHDFLAPCIYEGEGEMLGMAFFKSLVKAHGKTYFEPIGQCLHDADVRQPNLANPKHLWLLRRPMAHYAKWLLAQPFRGSEPAFSEMADDLRPFAKWSASFLRKQGYAVSGAMRKHQLRLADRQCAMANLSSRIQDAVVMLCTAIHGAKQSDPISRSAAALMCRELQRRLTGKPALDRDWRHMTNLGHQIVNHGWEELASIEPDATLMDYQN